MDNESYEPSNYRFDGSQASEAEWDSEWDSYNTASTDHSTSNVSSDESWCLDKEDHRTYPKKSKTQKLITDYFVKI